MLSIDPKRVLVVDDEPLVADTLALILKQNGFEAKAVYSGEAAVDAAQVLQPDVVITDFAMGAMNGIEAALRISAVRPGCRIILFSGNVMLTDLQHETENLAVPFEILSKPLHPDVLLAHLVSC
jgi:CheY-like chemotaxis protein